MTDNQVISFLRHIIYSAENSDGLYAYCVNIKNLKAALDLIKRQKAEIENLKDELHRAKVEISKHFDYMDSAANEAIKEFAERLKEYSRELQITTDTSLLIVGVGRIDNLVEEMTEVQG